MKKFAAVLSFFALFLYNGKALADASAAVLLEEKTGRVLYASGETQRLPMASTTKIMTALLALENGDLSDIVTAGDNAYGVPGTSIYLEKGENLTLEQMLYGLMLASGNDAAVAIAEHIGGSVAEFCEMMNARAAEIGCTGTHFTTPHGLPAEQHYTTAYDLALIAREAMQNPTFRKIVSTQRATIPWVNHDYDRVLTNKNKLLTTYAGALGIKTGYTKAAGRCLAFAAERNGMTVIGVVLNCPDWFEHSAALLDRAFTDYALYTALERGEIVHDVPVSNGVEDSVRLVAGEALRAPIAAGETPDISFRWPETLPAGFEAGETVGTASLLLNGQTLCAVPLLTEQSVPERTFLFEIGTELENWLVAAP